MSQLLYYHNNNSTSNNFIWNCVVEAPNFQSKFPLTFVPETAWDLGQRCIIYLSTETYSEFWRTAWIYLYRVHSPSCLWIQECIGKYWCNLFISCVNDLFICIYKPAFISAVEISNKHIYSIVQTTVWFGIELSIQQQINTNWNASLSQMSSNKCSAICFFLILSQQVERRLPDVPWGKKKKKNLTLIPSRHT